jgi:hypothetical protein
MMGTKKMNNTLSLKAKGGNTQISQAYLLKLVHSTQWNYCLTGEGIHSHWVHQERLPDLEKIFKQDVKGQAEFWHPED